MEKKIISEDANASSELSILKNLHNRDHSIRSQALKSLEKINNKAYFEEVVKLLKDNNAMVRVDAIETVFYLGEEKSLSYLIKMLDDAHRIVRSRAATFIGWLGEKSAIKNLEISLSREHSNSAKVGLLEGLYLLGQKDRLWELLSLLKSKKYQVRCAVANTVKDLIIENDSREIVINILKKALDVEPTVAARSSIKPALQQLEEERSCEKIDRDPPKFI